MQFNYIQDGIDALVVDGFYSEDQLKEINIELQWLTKSSILTDESKLASAVVDGQVQTSKTGVFLEDVFKNWRHSALISHLMKNIGSEPFVSKLLEINPLYKTLLYCNSRSHLLSYYENSDYYKPHTDMAVYTILSYFTKEPKQFTGGEIVLKSNNSTKEATIEVTNNRVVIIASCTLHEVKPIVSSMNNTLSGNGRYCNSAFLTVSDNYGIQK